MEKQVRAVGKLASEGVWLLIFLFWFYVAVQRKSGGGFSIEFASEGASRLRLPGRRHIGWRGVEALIDEGKKGSCSKELGQEESSY